MARAEHRRWTSVGTLIPLVLVVGLLADVSSRFLSYDAVSFRGWEALGRFLWPNQGPFQPRRQYVTDRSYGDLASMGNYPDRRLYREQTFTTDAFGFRNAIGEPNRPFAAILFGDSFSIGASLSDDETLASRLGLRIGRAVYNAAGQEPAKEPELTQLLQRLGMTSGFAIQEFVETAPPPQLDPPAPPLSRKERAEQWFRQRDPTGVYPWVRGWLANSPFKLALFVGFKRVENDLILPNPYATFAVPGRLTNGDPILFDPGQLTPSHPPNAVSEAVVYWRALDRLMRGHGLRLLVVLVPSSYAVYGDLTDVPGSPIRRDPFLASLEAALAAAHVPVISLEPLFQEAARAGLASRHYIYWRDDTHWNAAGADLAAGEIAAWIAKQPPGASRPGAQ